MQRLDLTFSKTQWSFRVRWAGYDESFDQWLDWNELKNVEALHRYLRRHNYAKFTPKSGQILEDKPIRKFKAKRPNELPKRKLCEVCPKIWPNPRR